MRTKAKQSLKPEVKKLILELLQNEGKCNYSTIEDYLKIKGIELKGKFLNKILQQMIEEDKSIERLNEKPRAVYRIRLDTNKILENHSTYFKEYTRNQFNLNKEIIFEEISSKNKVTDNEQGYLKKWIEYFGLYIFTALMESIPVISQIEITTKGEHDQAIQKALKNKKIKKEEFKNNLDLEAHRLIHLWLSNALSLETMTYSRPSFMFEKMLNDFKKSKNESGKTTQSRMIKSLKKLYPQTSEIILNTGVESDRVLNILKEQNYESVTKLDQLLGIISGKANKTTLDNLLNETRENGLKKKFNANF